jgi:hypothetical protein
MSNNNVTSRDQTINDLNRELRDDELDVVTGGVLIAMIAILIG